MKKHPIVVEKLSKGDWKSLTKNTIADSQRAAIKVQDYINSEMEKKPNNSVQQFMSYQIAHKINEDDQLVRDLIYCIDCGHNGVTIYKGDYEKALKLSD